MKRKKWRVSVEVYVVVVWEDYCSSEEEIVKIFECAEDAAMFVENDMESYTLRNWSNVEIRPYSLEMKK